MNSYSNFPCILPHEEIAGLIFKWMIPKKLDCLPCKPLISLFPFVQWYPRMQKSISNFFYFDISICSASRLLDKITIFTFLIRLFESHCVNTESVQIRSFFWSLFSCIQSKYRKIRTKKNSLLRLFSRSVRHHNSPFTTPVMTSKHKKI